MEKKVTTTEAFDFEIKEEDKEKTIASLKEKIDKIDKERQKYKRAYEITREENNLNAVRAREWREYKDYCKELEKKLAESQNNFTKKEAELFELQKTIDGALERALIAENDVVETRRLLIFKDISLKQIKKFFDWRISSNKPNHTLSLSEVDLIMTKIENGLSIKNLDFKKDLVVK